MQRAGIDDPFAIEIRRLQQQTLVAAAKHGALTALVHKDEGLRAGRIGHGDQPRIYAGSREFAAMEIARIVIAELADVARVQAPRLAGDDGGRGLAAGHDAGVGVFGLGAAGGKLR